MSDTIRVYQSDAAGSDGYDEGGNFRLETATIPATLKRRMARCYGCHDSFYNGRANCGGRNWCWSLEHAEYFRKRGRPTCYHC